MSRKDLKHILLYEAFDAKTISKTLNFLKKELGPDKMKNFINILNNIKTRYDLPIDKITDQDLEYLSRKEALKIKQTDEVTNELGIYCLKFWFSVEKGYVGYTGTGNKVISSSKINHPFNQEELDYLMNHQDERRMINIPKTGILEPIEDYNTLKHLDKIALYIDDHEDKSYLTAATLWKTDSEISAIQNRHDGNSPSGDWEQYGRYSWGLARYQNTLKPLKDHLRLHRYTPGNDPLVVIKHDLDNTINIFDYNLPLDSYDKLTSWVNSDSIGSIDNVNKSDFCIVLYLDRLLEKLGDDERPNVKKINRGENQKGATKLISDESIRNQNIDRYISGIITKIGITHNQITSTNLQKIASKTLGGDFALLACRYGYINRLQTFNRRLEELMCSINDEDSESFLKSKYNSVLDILKRIYSESNKREITLKSNIKFISEYYLDPNNESAHNEEGREDMTKIINKTLEIGHKISESVKNHKTESLADIKVIYYKLKSIRDITSGDDNDFYIGDLDSAFECLVTDKEKSRRYLDRFSRSTRKDIIKRLNNIDRYVTDIFR